MYWDLVQEYRSVARFGGSSTVADGPRYVGTRDKDRYAIDISDGSRRWTYDAEYPLSGSVAVADGVLVSGDDDGNIVVLVEP
ncbi:PQQ-binding-like beta-propeller repeat protein [Natrinema gelatinilyticum]|uniref:outer membrane protein assembly factor BamB family protein n=1 Tax=Natrinema gelatinilyticum TaxID=2961571 RepID=UPI003CE528DB